jgi:hypothetical protein
MAVSNIHMMRRGAHPGVPDVTSGQVMSVSAKPRLAGRQPSNRGGVPRVMTRLTAEVAEASAGPRQGPGSEEHAVSECMCK